jgi:hypothetical protein
VGEVFDHVADLRNEPKWHVEVASVPPESDSVPVVGRTYPVKFKPVHGQDRWLFHPLVIEPGSRVVYRGDFAGLQPRIIYTLERSGGSTRSTRAVEMQPSGLRVLMNPKMAFMVPRRNKIFVQNLKRALES